MKKLFTLVAVALVAMSASAQEEKWVVYNEDGTLKADYVANTDASAMSVVSFSTDNVTGTHTSGPIAGYTDGTTTPLEAKVDNSWGGIKSQALSKDGSVAPFYYVQGKGNPVNLDKITWEEVETDGVKTGTYRAKWDDSYYAPDGSNGLPTNGTYITVTPKVAGTMKVAVWVNKGSRDTYVVKASDKNALAFGTDVKASGYVQATNNETTDTESPLYGYMKYQEEIAMKGTEGTDAYVIGAGNRPVWAYLTFTAAANETYYIFNKSTQIGFGGFEFTAGASGISELTAAKTNANAPVYNLAGQRVSKDAKGILIQNGRKFIRK